MPAIAYYAQNYARPIAAALPLWFARQSPTFIKSIMYLKYSDFLTDVLRVVCILYNYHGLVQLPLMLLSYSVTPSQTF